MVAARIPYVINEEKVRRKTVGAVGAATAAYECGMVNSGEDNMCKT